MKHWHFFHPRQEISGRVRLSLGPQATVTAVPELDFALIADHVRPEGGVAHIIAAGVDTVTAAQVPTGYNFGVLVWLTFTRQECDRPHRIEIFQDADGARLAQLTAVVFPAWTEGLPAGWRQGVQGAFNVGIPLPAYGQYAFEVLINDNAVKSMPLRVVAPAEPAEQ